MMIKDPHDRGMGLNRVPRGAFELKVKGQAEVNQLNKGGKIIPRRGNMMCNPPLA